ncbi:DUF2304 domain-containing protein [Candidatus Woesearchaeota archaeon]|nr:DUF2304 domain-containing protein [Candidatus Woesearchaeota archaeon]
MALGIQIGGTFFGIFMLYYSFLNYKRKQFTKKEFVFWASIWAMFIIVAVYPPVLNPFIVYFKFLRALDLLVIAGFMLLIFVSFYTYTITRRNQKQLEEIVRAVALRGKRK